MRAGAPLRHSQRNAVPSYRPARRERAIFGASAPAAPHRPTMKYSLRKTPSHLHLAYKYGEGTDGVTGRNFTLEVEDRLLTVAIDVTPNFHIRNKSSPAYLDATNLAHNYHKLKSLQCTDNLVRARLIRAWDQIEQPQMRLALDLGERGRYVYAVQPHSLFTGGIQFEVQELLEEHPGMGYAPEMEYQGGEKHA